MPIRALDCTGSGFLSDIATAITYAADNGAGVVSLSLGSSAPSATRASVRSGSMRRALLAIYAAFIRPFAGRGFRRRVPILDRLHHALMDRLEVGPFDIRGQRMYLDPKDSLRLRTHPYEPFETELVQRMVRRGDVVVDIGANIGYYTLIFAERVGPEGEVIAFEPEPANFRLLRKNVELNGHRNVVQVNKAVGDTARPIALYLAHVNIGDHRVFDTYRDRRAVMVPCVRLDDELASYPRPIHLIKMDIQGAEWSALRGMEGLLRRDPDVMLLTEYAPPLLAQFGVEPRAYLDLLISHGFRLYEVDESAREVRPVEVASLEARYRPDTEDYTNLLCVRGARPGLH